MYQVLYRKWRPQTFDSVYGQAQVTQTLKNQIKNQRFGHAYLFTGTRGTGKTTCAKILAKAVNCLNQQGGDPCGECENCRAVESGAMLDIVEMDAASNRRIDDIRSIIDESAFNPSKGKYRVYIIDEVHMLTKEAFNALLKTLEEPPEHVIFILATTEVDELPATILSRCQRFDFNRIRREDIAQRLHFVADKEGVGLTQDAALLIASVADGAMRDALSLLDRCIGISEQIDIRVVRVAAGLAQKDYISGLANACINKNCATALEIIDRLHGESKSMLRLCEELISHFRNLMLIKTVKNPRNIVFMTDEEFDDSVLQCQNLSLSEIIYIIDILSSAQDKMGRGNSNRTELESALVKLCSPELEVTTEALLSRIANLEKQINRLSAGVAVNNSLGNSIDSAEKSIQSKLSQDVNKQSATENLTSDNNDRVTMPESSFTAVRKPIKPSDTNVQTEQSVNVTGKSVAPKSAVDFDQIVKNAVPFAMWPEVIEEISKYSKTIASALKGSTAYTSANYLLIDTENDLAYELLKNSAQKNSIRNTVFNISGIKYSMGPYKKRDSNSQPNDTLLKFINDAKSNGINVTEFQ